MIVELSLLTKDLADPLGKYLVYDAADRRLPLSCNPVVLSQSNNGLTLNHEMLNTQLSGKNIVFSLDAPEHCNAFTTANAADDTRKEAIVAGLKAVGLPVQEPE